MQVETKAALALFAGSILLTVLCFLLGLPFFFLFLFVPLFLLFPGRRVQKVCPVCGAVSSRDSAYCRVCGAKLEGAEV